MGVNVDDQWRDPILITPDVSSCTNQQRQHFPSLSLRSSTIVPSSQHSTMSNTDDICSIHGECALLQDQSLEANDTEESIDWVPENVSITLASSERSIMDDTDEVHSYMGKCISWQDQNVEPSSTDKDFIHPISHFPARGQSVVGFSLTTPDLVICAKSPDIPSNSCEDPSMFLKAAPIEISLEDGINGPKQIEGPKENQVFANVSASREIIEEDNACSEVSLELHPVPMIGKPEKERWDCEVEDAYEKLRVDYEFQREELTETRHALDELKRENESKSRECQEALKSLQELQNELMRKSMHVGSLAFAIEGQVKEKSRWFSSIRDLKRKLKILKMDHLKLAEETSAYKKCLVDMNEIGLTIQSRLSEEVKSHEDLRVKFIKGSKEQKELYNKILELKGNIRVFCRCRPLNSGELDLGAAMAIDFEAAKDGELTVKSSGVLRKAFKFDAVFGPHSSQDDVFEDTAPFATSVLDGYNVCIFAYGQTGTGKTFTMEGTNEARGVNYRTLEELFNIVRERKGQFQYEISVSVLEVYNEQIRDLLLSGTQPGATAKRLEVRQVGDGIHHVPGLVEAHVNNMSEVWEVLKTGSDARAVGSTNANEYSSRSHCLHCVMVNGKNLLSGECTRSKLWLVDLAGSERVAKTEVQGERLKEAQNINRSLSALGDVISALAAKSPHIPFRNSKLTHLLQDSLGGDSKTLMFVQISPNEDDLSETLCSLNFASRVRGIELGLAKKQLDNTEFLRHKQMADKTKLDLKSKDVQIKKMEETIYGLDVKIKEKDSKNKGLQDKIKELEAQLLIERRLARQHVDSKIAEQQQQKFIRQEEYGAASIRPPLATKPLGTSPCFPSVSENILQSNDPEEKENNPKLTTGTPLIPKRTGRASLCPVLLKNPIAPPPTRRNSLIPLPSSTLGLPKFSKPLMPLPPIQASKGEMDQDKSEPTSCFSPKEQKRREGKKLGFILRRSLQKRYQMRSPKNQQARRGGNGGGGGGVSVGMEKVRVSITNRGRVAHRVLLGSAKRSSKDIEQKQNQRERGWNNRIAI